MMLLFRLDFGWTDDSDKIWQFLLLLSYLIPICTCIGFRDVTSEAPPVPGGTAASSPAHRGAARQMYGSGSLRPPGSVPPIYGLPMQHPNKANATNDQQQQSQIKLKSQYGYESRDAEPDFSYPTYLQVGRQVYPYAQYTHGKVMYPKIPYTILPQPMSPGIDGSYPYYNVPKPMYNYHNSTYRSKGMNPLNRNRNKHAGIYGGRIEYNNGRPMPITFGGKYPFDVGVVRKRPQLGEDHFVKVVNDHDNSEGAAGKDDVFSDQSCGPDCKPSEFMCIRSCTCIDKSYRCNREMDCMDEEDEMDCSDEEYEAHDTNCDKNETGFIRCPMSQKCISKSWLCDGDDDCGDFSDETNCGARITCNKDQFECNNGLCIPITWKCDDDNDCKDYSDELNCTKLGCTSDEFTCGDGSCISIGWKCDRQEDCADGSDEVDCDEEPPVCRKGEFQCTYKKCIKNEFKCDDDNDCGDWSDEDNCKKPFGKCVSGEFKCNNGFCIPEVWRCDKQSDCEDGEDEINCNEKPLRTCSSDEHACNNGACILKTWVCDGVADCSHGEDEDKCKIFCDESKFPCKGLGKAANITADCVSKKHVCDGQKDCASGNDELNCPKHRECDKDTNCTQLCILTSDDKPACACSPGFKLNLDGITCVDVNECLYEIDPVCSQTCNNTIGSFKCGCMTGYVLRPDLRSCKAMGASPTLLFANRMDIRQVSLSNNKYTAILKNLQNAIALDYHYSKNLIFWSDVSTDVIRKAYVNGTGVTDVVKWGLESPGGIAIDWIHDLLFWTDSGTRRVGVSTLDGSQSSIIVAHELDKPRAIVVHPGEALVFWTDWGPSPKIERSDMDGSNRRNVITESVFWPNGLTLDYIADKIYWADAKHNVIETAKFDGTERKKVITKGLPHPFALTIFEDAIYWTDWHTKAIATANKITGAGFRTIHSHLHFPMDIHSYHPQRQPKYKNRCGSNNGGCAHLCLPNFKGYSCQCRMEMKLRLDGKSCQKPEKLLIFARKKDVRIRHLDNNAVKDHDIVLPLDGVKSAIAIAWDAKTDSIFWTDIEKDTINKVHWNGSNQQIILHSNIVTPAGLAFDWLTNKLYWTDTDSAKIEVATDDGSLRSLLIWEHLDKPRDIVVDPIAGYMYWSDWGKKPKIERAAMDGTMRIELITHDLTWPNGLAIDYSAERLCWGDGGTKSIECSNMDGTHRKVLIGNLMHPFGLDIYGSGLYWTDWESYNIERVNKNTGGNRTVLGSGITDLMDVRVYHHNRKFVKTACSNDNGGCSYLCLLRPNKEHSCSCPVGINLLDDKRTCAKSPMNSLIFAHRYDIRQISLDVPYLIDVVLPLPPLKHVVSVDVDRKTDDIYWTDTSTDLIQKSSSDGKVITNVISHELQQADAIAVDSTGRKIYWTDCERNSIEVAELDGSSRKVLIWQDLDNPRAIALHYYHGLMFWSDWGDKPCIEVSEMDGNNRRKIITTELKWPNGLAIDRPANRLFWNDGDLKKIESSNLDGTDRRIIVTDLKHPYGLVVVGNHIYWTDWKTPGLHRADKNNGSDNAVIKEKLEGAMDIRSVQSDNATINACGNKNGGCSHLCLRNSLSYSCACPTGVPLTKGSTKICESIPTNYLFLAARTSIIRISLETDLLWDTTLPLNNVSHAMDVDFHYEQKLLAYSDIDNNYIRLMRMTNFSDYYDITTKNKSTISGIAIDWIANQIYWTDTLGKKIEVCKLDGTSRKVIVKNMLEPRAIAVFPRKGFLFWTQWGKVPRIERSYLDGSYKKTIVEIDIVYPNGLVIDYHAKRIYWSDAKLDRLETADLAGRNRIQLIHGSMGKAGHTQPFGLALHGDYIYWTDWFQKQVLRAEKVNGKNPTVVRSDLEGALGVVAVSDDRQLGWNPCAEDNGGCTHLCFYIVTNYTCRCPDEPDHHKPCKKEMKFLVSLKKPPNADGTRYEYEDDTDEDSYYDTNSIYESGSGSASKTTSSSYSGTFYAMTLISMLFIVLLSIVMLFGAIAYRSRRNKLVLYGTGGTGGNRSVMTFANPNYFPPNYPQDKTTHGASTPEGAVVGDKKPFLWKRLKYDKSHDRVYEDKGNNGPEVTSLIPSVMTPSSSNCEAVTPEFERSPSITPLHRMDSIPLKTIT